MNKQTDDPKKYSKLMAEGVALFRTALADIQPNSREALGI